MGFSLRKVLTSEDWGCIMVVRIGTACVVQMIELGAWKTKGGRHSLAQLIAEDAVVAKRGKPSLPKLKFMEGLGPEDPRFDVGVEDGTRSRAA